MITYRVSWLTPYPAEAGERHYRDFADREAAEGFAAFTRALDPFPGSYDVRVDPV